MFGKQKEFSQLLYVLPYYSVKLWQGKTLVNLKKRMSFANILHYPNLRFPQVAIC